MNLILWTLFTLDVILLKKHLIDKFLYHQNINIKELFLEPIRLLHNIPSNMSDMKCMQNMCWDQSKLSVFFIVFAKVNGSDE